MFSQIHTQAFEDLRQGIRECINCQTVCQETVNYSLEIGGKFAEASQIGLLLDCADICLTSADFMLRQSPSTHAACDLCAQVCERAAAACEQFDDEQLQCCAAACRSCAEVCRQIGLGQVIDTHATLG